MATSPEIQIENEPNEPEFVDAILARDNRLGFWIIISLIVMATALVANNIVRSWQPPPPPYILKVACHGDDCQPVGQIIPILSVQAIPDGLLRAQLADFIHDAFSIDSNSDEEQLLFDKTQSRVTGHAYSKLDEWYHRDNGRHDPRVVNRYINATAISEPVLKLQGNRYLSNFTVTAHANADMTVTKTNYRATLHVIVGRTSDPESAGWFVDDIDWQEVKQ